MLGLDRLKLDGNLFTRDDVCAQVNVTERATANLAADTILITDPKILLIYQYVIPVYSSLAMLSGWTYHRRHLDGLIEPR